MAAPTGPTYGTPNWDLLGRWLQLDPADDGPFWALNLMKYRAVANYGDGASTRTGREADDAYAPLGPLAAIGAEVAFLGDVRDQLLGEPRWDRVGIVRYPSRSAFFAMQQRDDFKRQHVHKEAGMEFTIVMSCLPLRHPSIVPTEGSLLLAVESVAAPGPDTAGVREVASFSVEGVIVGDERTFERARFLRVADGTARAAVVDTASAAGGAHVLVLDPSIDRLVDTLATAPGGG